MGRETCQIKCKDAREAIELLNAYTFSTLSMLILVFSSFFQVFSKYSIVKFMYLIRLHV